MRRTAIKTEGCHFSFFLKGSQGSHNFLLFTQKKRMKLLFAVATSLVVALAPNPVKGGNPNPHMCETDDPPGIKCHTSVSP
jgi:hypothetical protein